MSSPLDVLLVVPFEPVSSYVIEPHVREDFGTSYSSLMHAAAEFSEYAGFDLTSLPSIGGPRPRFAFRSLTAVTLGTHLEREGLAWAALDPGEQDVGKWRRDLVAFKKKHGAPRTIAFCTTFVIAVRWQSVLLSLLRKTFPDSKLLIGGYFYSTDSRSFLSLDGDYYCVGEGELRLPEMVKAIRDGRPLDHIRGLYIRQPGGALHYTGPVDQLDLGQLPPVDWALARSDKIAPKVDLEEDTISVGVETQRGCVFKCEFCTFRTLIGPNQMSAERAADAILRASRIKKGFVSLVDATGTFPHDRWEDILRRLIARGGSPHPMWLYARVSDLSEPTVALMAQAGVRAVFIGQESGDEKMLQAMKKGTHTSQIRPAVQALGKHGIVGQFGFIHGFPGETAETVARTRQVLTSLNDGFEGRPVVLIANVGPMQYQDFASSGYQQLGRPPDPGSDRWRRLLGNPRQYPQRPRGWGYAVIETYMVLSRLPHAPAWDMFNGDDPRNDPFHLSLYTNPHRDEIFRWTKALQRGICIFLEERWEGKRPDGAELARVRDVVRAGLPPEAVSRALGARTRRRLASAVLGRLSKEFQSEPEKGFGRLTRALAALKALDDTGRFGAARRAWRDSTTLPFPGVAAGEQAASADVDELARKLVDEAIDSSQRWRQERKQRRLQGVGQPEAVLAAPPASGGAVHKVQA